jgi:hypothetical protein
MVSAPKVVRVWVAPWRDEKNRLHEASFLYMMIEDSDWVYGRERRRIPTKQRARGVIVPTMSNMIERPNQRDRRGPDGQQQPAPREQQQQMLREQQQMLREQRQMQQQLIPMPPQMPGLGMPPNPAMQMMPGVGQPGMMGPPGMMGFGGMGDMGGIDDGMMP